VKISVIIPAVNEGQNLPTTLKRIKEERPYEIIVVNGNSKDNTAEISKKYAHVLTIKEKSWRSTLMNAGAARATGDTLLFLHADTILPKKSLKKIPKKTQAAAFFIMFDYDHWFLKTAAWYANNIRLRRGIAFGDHGLLITKDLFDNVRGYPNISIFEDLELCKRIKKHTALFLLKEPVITSSRRYLTTGLLKQFLINQLVKTFHFLHVNHLAVRNIYVQLKR